jgi:hypothetical protein
MQLLAHSMEGEDIRVPTWFFVTRTRRQDRERERWTRLYQLAPELSRGWGFGRCFDTACIVGVFLWAVLHDHPVSWACDPIVASPCRFWRTEAMRNFISNGLKSNATSRKLDELRRRPFTPAQLGPPPSSRPTLDSGQITHQCPTHPSKTASNCIMLLRVGLVSGFSRTEEKF